MRNKLPVNRLVFALIFSLAAAAPTHVGAQADGGLPQTTQTPGSFTGLGAKEDADLAYGAFQRGLYLTAFELALPRAKTGDAAAQTLIAELYEKGLGIPRDTKQAAAWYEIAAKSGNREAQFSFAVKLLKGVDVAQDKERGLAMMAEAADAGHPVAMFNQAHQIVSERPTSAGYRKALPLFETAAEFGVGDAFYTLSQIYQGGLADGIQNPEKARHWLIRAARAGVDTAQVELAISLANGTGGPQDSTLAVTWFTVAANGGNVIAQNRLAHLLSQGIGGKPNPIEAAKWHILAQRAGRGDLKLDTFLKSLSKDDRARALGLANRWPLYK